MITTRPGPDWFTNGYAQEAFERHLLPLGGNEQVHALQIGAYCGDASEWLLRNVLTGHGSWLVDVDTWEGSQETAHRVIDFDAVKDYYEERMSKFNHVGYFHGTSDQYFAQIPSPFNFIYIDGAHTTEQVLRDAVNADRYLKVGGIIAFDDHYWSDGTEDRPGPAIDAFVRCYQERYEVLENNWQVWMRRVR